MLAKALFFLQFVHRNFAGELALAVVKERGQVRLCDGGIAGLGRGVEFLPVKIGTRGEQSVAPMPCRALAKFSIVILAARPNNAVVCFVIAGGLHDEDATRNGAERVRAG